VRDLQFPGRSPAYAVGAMAATSVPLATLTALDILRAGGNALDAAVGATALLGVIEPQSTGIGGDCFCLYQPAGGAVLALNGSGRAPGASDPQALRRLGMTALEPTSAHAVTVPGALCAWETLIEAHGRKSLEELLQPAIRHAEEGFAVTPRVAFDWALETHKLRATGADDFLPGGAAPAAGTIFRQPRLAATLRRIAREGAKAFYEGEIAAGMVETLRDRGGVHTLEDFAAGRGAAQFVAPIRTAWRGYEVWECPPNGTGLMALMLLGILDGMDLGADPYGVRRLHAHAEAARLVYRDRDAFIADPAHGGDAVARLLRPQYLDSLRALIDPARALPNLPPAGEGALSAHRDTVTVSVVDRDGNACSLINSTFQSFGSGIVSARDGIVLHNRGHGFTLQEGHPNELGPHKRPLHTILPGMLTRDGRAVMPFGVMGGYYQPMGHVWLLTNLLQYGLDLQEAIDFPRLLPRHGLLEVERGFSDATRASLRGLGQVVVVPTEPLGGAQAVWIDRARGVLIGGSDPRKDGCALGY